MNPPTTRPFWLAGHRPSIGSIRGFTKKSIYISANPPTSMPSSQYAVAPYAVDWLYLWIQHQTMTKAMATATATATKTQLGKNLLAKKIAARRISWRKFTNCLKLYLAFERWVTEAHPRSAIRDSKVLLGDLISMIKDCFPRDDGWGWNLPKCMLMPKCPITR